MPIDTAALNKLVLDLWGDVVSLPTPTTAVALWKEHQTIRRLLAEIDKVNPPHPIFANRQRRADKLDGFLKWSEKVGIETNRVTVEACGALGDEALGLKATGDIEEKQSLVKVPRRAMLTWDDARKSTMLAMLFDQDPIVRGMDNVVLALMLICELLKGEESRWQAYLAVMPETFSTPLFYTEEELEWLRPSPTFEDALKMYRSIARQFAYFHMIVQRNDQAQKARRNKEREARGVPLLEKSPLTVTNFSFHLYKWAVACVSTRINLIPSEQATRPDGSPVQIPALIPFLDMANHAFHCDGADKMSVHFCVETDRAGCVATEDYHHGDDVHIF
uniref:protein-histidine N-methyltransferase n=1 Tax=Plectus sambesii TaxID=2011161 RepID=A0A914VA21_9BILA